MLIVRKTLNQPFCCWETNFCWRNVDWVAEDKEVEAVDGVLEGVCFASCEQVAQVVIERRRWPPEQEDEEVVLDAVEETLAVAVIRFRLTYFIRGKARASIYIS